MKEKLAVIVPVYNAQEYLEQCLESIIEQTFTKLQIILVDDGSLDESGAICDLFAEKDERVTVIHQENGGLINARYTGLLMAEADYVSFVDADDWIDNSMYEKLMGLLLENKADMVTSGCIRYWDANDFVESIDWTVEPGIYDRNDIEKKIIPRMLWCKERDTWAVDPSLCMKIFKKELLLKQYERIKACSFLYGEDTAILYPYILESQRIYFSHNKYYFHRQRKRGEIASYFIGEEYFDNLFCLYRYLKTVFSESQYMDVLMVQLEHFYIRSVNRRKIKYGVMNQTSHSYVFPFDKVEKDSRIILYGAGKVGHQYKQQIEQIHYCEIMLWVDANYREEGVVGLDRLDGIDYDYIVIANASRSAVDLIKKNLLKLGIDEKKILR